jgi:CRP-like cAMP-binding protein
VEVTKRTLEDEQYTVAVLRDHDHAFFGELALLDEDRRSATIRTLQDCEVLALKRKDFEALGNTHPDIGLVITRELGKMICRRFRGTSEDVILLFEALVNEIRTEEID